MTSAVALIKENKKTVIWDVLILTAIYFVPSFSHMLSWPLYLLEPIRIALILAVAHTRKENAYFMALTIPVFSYLVSGHPYAEKMLIISLELAANVWLFFFLNKRIRLPFISMALAVVLSKALYYACQYVLLLMMFPAEHFGHHALWLQAIVTLALSAYIQFFYEKNSKSKS